MKSEQEDVEFLRKRIEEMINKCRSRAHWFSEKPYTEDEFERDLQILNMELLQTAKVEKVLERIFKESKEELIKLISQDAYYNDNVRYIQGTLDRLNSFVEEGRTKGKNYPQGNFFNDHIADMGGPEKSKVVETLERLQHYLLKEDEVVKAKQRMIKKLELLMKQAEKND